MRVVPFLAILLLSTQIMAQSTAQGRLEKLTNFFRMMTCVQAYESLEQGQWSSQPWQMIAHQHEWFFQYGQTSGKDERCGVIKTVNQQKKTKLFNKMLTELSKVIALIGQDIPVEGLPEQPFFIGESLLNQITFDFNIEEPVLTKTANTLLLDQDNRVRTYISYVLSDTEYKDKDAVSLRLNQDQSFNQADDELSPGTLVGYIEAVNNNQEQENDGDDITNSGAKAESASDYWNNASEEVMDVEALPLSKSLPVERITFPQAVAKLKDQPSSKTQTSTQVSMDSVKEDLKQVEREAYDYALN